nr:MAG TPA: hypothetical protein [Caudoviricetes sp.]
MQIKILVYANKFARLQFPSLYKRGEKYSSSG